MNAVSLSGSSSQVQYSSLFASISVSHTNSSGTSANGSSGSADQGNYVDTISISLESIQASSVSSSSSQKASTGTSQVSSNSNGSSAESLIKMIKDQLDAIKKYLISSALGTNNSTNASSSANSTTTDGIQGLPAYWGSEQTSQRIVDFATSFAGMTGKSGKDFYNAMVAAVKDGFGQAAKETGNNLPSTVSSLTSKTEALVLEKLKTWAQNNGIQVDDSTSTTASSQGTSSGTINLSA